MGAPLSSCGLFPKVGNKSAMTVHALSCCRACIHIAVRMRQVIGGACQSSRANISENRAMAAVAVSCKDGKVNALHPVWSGWH